MPGTTSNKVQRNTKTAVMTLVAKNFQDIFFASKKDPLTVGRSLAFLTITKRPAREMIAMTTRNTTLPAPKRINRYLRNNNTILPLFKKVRTPFRINIIARGSNPKRGTNNMPTNRQKLFLYKTHDSLSKTATGLIFLFIGPPARASAEAVVCDCDTV